MYKYWCAYEIKNGISHSVIRYDLYIFLHSLNFFREIKIKTKKENVMILDYQINRGFQQL